MCVCCVYTKVAPERQRCGWLGVTAANESSGWLAGIVAIAKVVNIGKGQRQQSVGAEGQAKEPELELELGQRIVEMLE